MRSDRNDQLGRRRNGAQPCAHADRASAATTKCVPCAGAMLTNFSGVRLLLIDRFNELCGPAESGRIAEPRQQILGIPAVPPASGCKTMLAAWLIAHRAETRAEAAANGHLAGRRPNGLGLGTRLVRTRCRFIRLVGEHAMPNMKTFGLAIGIAFAASSFALAQQGSPNAPASGGGPQGTPPASSAQGSPPANAAASGGAGTHQNSLKTGTSANTQKVQHNRKGYRHVYSYYRGGRCHLFHRPGTTHLVRICH